MNTLLPFTAGLLVLPVGFGLVALTLRLLAYILGAIEHDRFPKRKEVDPWAVGAVAVRLAVSATGYTALSFAGWGIIITPPTPKEKKKRDSEVQTAVTKAVRQPRPATYPSRTPGLPYTHPAGTRRGTQTHRFPRAPRQ